MRKKVLIQSGYALLRLLVLGLAAYLLYFALQLALTGAFWKNFLETWTGFFDGSSPVFWVNYGVALGLVSLIIAIIGDYWLGLATATSLGIIFIFVDYTKIVSRSEPLLPSDFLMAGQAGDLIQMIKLKAIFLLLGTILLVFLVAYLLHRWSQSLWWNYHTLVWPLRVLVVVSLGGLLTLFSQAGNSKSLAAVKLSQWGMENIDHEQLANYQNRGSLVAFTFNIKTDPMTRPHNYSAATMATIAKRYRNGLAQQNQGKRFADVNIIYILNESLTNPERTADRYPLKGTQNPTPYLTQILDNPAENQASGYMISPGFGGGTANIEFEANTGFSNYFLNNTPYQDILSKKSYFPSLMHYLNSAHYQSQAYHPYSGTMYRRRQVYPGLGIKQFRDQNQLKGLKQSPYGFYTSDASAYPNFYAQQKQTRQFSLMITMQNHMPFEADKGNNTAFTLESPVDNDQDKTNRLQAYFQEVNASDRAFKHLVRHYQRAKEKTLIVMYGDHYPGDGIYDDLYKVDTLNSHATPFVMVANFPLTQHNYDYFSPNYMSLLLLQQLGYPLTPFYNMLIQLQQQIPVLTKPLQIDAQGKKYTARIDTDPQQATEPKNSSTKNAWTKIQVYQDYRLLEYDVTFGNNYARKYHMFDVND